jgi:hypothetical protein
MAVGQVNTPLVSAGLSAQPLVTAAQPITPDAVNQLVDSFRQGNITAQDIIDHVGDVAQSKKRALLEELGEYVDPEMIKARLSAARAQGATANLAQKTAEAGQTLVQPQTALTASQIGAQQQMVQPQLDVALQQLNMQKDMMYPWAVMGYARSMLKSTKEIKSTTAKGERVRQLNDLQQDITGPKGELGDDDYYGGSDWYHYYTNLYQNPTSVTPGSIPFLPHPDANKGTPTAPYPVPGTPAPPAPGNPAAMVAPATPPVAGPPPVVTPATAPLPIVAPAGNSGYMVNTGAVAPPAAKIADDVRALDAYKAWDNSRSHYASFQKAWEPLSKLTDDKQKSMELGTVDVGLLNDAAHILNPQSLRPPSETTLEGIAHSADYPSKIKAWASLAKGTAKLPPDTRREVAELVNRSMESRVEGVKPLFQGVLDKANYWKSQVNSARAGEFSPEQVLLPHERAVLSGEGEGGGTTAVVPPSVSPIATIGKNKARRVGPNQWQKLP